MYSACRGELYLRGACVSEMVQSNTNGQILLSYICVSLERPCRPPKFFSVTPIWLDSSADDFSAVYVPLYSVAGAPLPKARYIIPESPSPRDSYSPTSLSGFQLSAVISCRSTLLLFISLSSCPGHTHHPKVTLHFNSIGGLSLQSQVNRHVNSFHWIRLFYMAVRHVPFWQACLCFTWAISGFGSTADLASELQQGHWKLGSHS